MRETDLRAGLHVAVFDGALAILRPEGTWTLQVHLQRREEGKRKEE